jgi:hypothetical protein
MKTQIMRAGVALALFSLSFGMAKAAPPKEAPECPVCHMKLSAKKTKDSTVAVKLTPKAKTMYCCAKCTMPDEVLVKKPAPKPKK